MQTDIPDRKSSSVSHSLRCSDDQSELSDRVDPSNRLGMRLVRSAKRQSHDYNNDRSTHRRASQRMVTAVASHRIVAADAQMALKVEAMKHGRGGRTMRSIVSPNPMAGYASIGSVHLNPPAHATLTAKTGLPDHSSHLENVRMTSPQRIAKR